jgi:hypothetical protein
MLIGDERLVALAPFAEEEAAEHRLGESAALLGDPLGGNPADRPRRLGESPERVVGGVFALLLRTRAAFRPIPLDPSRSCG